MKVHDILNGSTQFATIINECSQFIEESGGAPLFRALPVSYDDMQKVKVRKKKSNTINETFNQAFHDFHPELRQRAVFTNGNANDIALEEGTEPFFVYPIDGYKYMYSVNISNSSQQYDQVFESIIDTFGDTSGSSTITDMLKFTYVHDHLAEGIMSGAEIVLFNIPYYYAVRVNEDTLSELSNIGSV